MKTKQTILCGILAVIIALSFTACPEEDDTPEGKSVPGKTLAEKLTWVKNADNVEDGKSYVIKVDDDEAIDPQTLSYSSKYNITITIWGGGKKRTISLLSSGSLFTAGSNVTLALDNNITLQGKSGNNGPLVRVYSGGALEMRDGAKITGNTTSSGAGGVQVSNNATFTMNGGEISGNTTTLTSFGGGVDLFGTFTMNGGVISGNTSYTGGGVYVNSSSIFTMNGGEISGNTASSYGGGVLNGGTFRIVNGTVYGSNESNASLKNTANNGAALSGTAQRGTFSGATWNSAGTLTTTNDTIKVVKGELQ